MATAVASGSVAPAPAARPVRVLPGATPLPPPLRPDIEAFLRGAAAAPPLVRHADGLSAEAREEAVDLCAAAVEKHPADVERCIQVERESDGSVDLFPTTTPLALAVRVFPVDPPLFRDGTKELQTKRRSRFCPLSPAFHSTFVPLKQHRDQTIVPHKPDKPIQTIKEAMDRRFGGRWHAVAGRGFAFAVTHQELLHVCVAGSVGVLLWKL